MSDTVKTLSVSQRPTSDVHTKTGLTPEHNKDVEKICGNNFTDNRKYRNKKLKPSEESLRFNGERKIAPSTKAMHLSPDTRLRLALELQGNDGEIHIHNVNQTEPQHVFRNNQNQQNRAQIDVHAAAGITPEHDQMMDDRSPIILGDLNTEMLKGSEHWDQ